MNYTLILKPLVAAVTSAVLPLALVAADVFPRVVEQVRRIYPIILTERIDLNTAEKSAEYNQAKAELKGLGEQADHALVELAKDIEFRELHSNYLFDFLARNRDLVEDVLPIARGIIHDYLNAPDSNRMPRAVSGAEGYLIAWGSESDLDLMRRSGQKASKSNPTQIERMERNIERAKEFQERRRKGLPRPSEEPPRGPLRFYESGFTKEDWLEIRRKEIPGFVEQEAKYNALMGREKEVANPATPPVRKVETSNVTQRAEKNT